jgi:N-acetylglucosamine kinase-like BadF-type ATPase
MRGADGTGPPTALTAMVRRAFDSLVGAEQQVHRHPTDRELLARLVPRVAALPQDAEARRILAEAAGHLVELAAALRRRLGPLPVAGVGGIFRCAPVRDAFRGATGATEPAEPPELGALRLLDR